MKELFWELIHVIDPLHGRQYNSFTFHGSDYAVANLTIGANSLEAIRTTYVYSCAVEHRPLITP